MSAWEVRKIAWRKSDDGDYVAWMARMRDLGWDLRVDLGDGSDDEGRMGRVWECWRPRVASTDVVFDPPVDVRGVVM